MKKIVSALIVAALFVCCMVPAAFAAGSATVSVSSAEYAGEPVTLTVSISEAEFATYGMTASYDTSVLELTSIKRGDVQLGFFVPNKGNATVTDTGTGYDDDFNPLPAMSGSLFTLTFNVAEDAKPGTYTVSVSGNVTDRNAETLSVSWGAGAVVIPCTAHEFGDWAETKAPNCTAAGEKSRTCVYCGATETETIAALGHTFGEWTVTTAPACEVEGVETATCSVCGETKTQAVAALEHQWGEWVTVKEAAIGVTGLMERTCSVCGEVQQQTIPALADPDLDDVPQTGDITMQLTAGIATVVVALFAGVAFVFKRKTAK